MTRLFQALALAMLGGLALATHLCPGARDDALGAHPARRQLLRLLKTRWDTACTTRRSFVLPLEQLADQYTLTPEVVHEHLRALEVAGYVTSVPAPAREMSPGFYITALGDWLLSDRDNL